MKIKSLILGSAALLAVSGVARAADAIMPAAEPEPANYVKVCDAYGAGFFYIPGTETCMSINGYVWYEFGGSNARDPFSVGTGLGTDTPAYGEGQSRGRGWVSDDRVRMNFDLRSQTELGTLRGWIRLQSDFDAKDAGRSGAFNTPGGKTYDGAVAIDQAWVQLGGLAMGYGESAFFYQFNRGAISYGSFSWGGMYYGYQERQQIRYEFGGAAGLFGLISLEDPADEDSYVPDVVGRIGYGQSWGDVWLTATYDHDRTGRLIGDSSAFAVSPGLLYNIPGSPGSALKVIGYYNTADSNYGPGSALGVQPEWSILASYNAQFTPNFALIVSGQYFDNFYAPGSSDHLVLRGSDHINAYGAELSAVWLPVKNFEVRPELHYDKVDTLDASYSGFLRFTRYF